MLNEISSICNKNDIGLYRDDGLGVMNRIGGPEIERRKKKIIQTFKKHKLDITVKANLKVVQYLNVEFDLSNNVYKPYRKPNNEPLYVNVKSNHPPNVNPKRHRKTTFRIIFVRGGIQGSGPRVRRSAQEMKS